MSTSELVPPRDTAAPGRLVQFLTRFHWRDAAQSITITLGAILASLVLFALYMLIRYGVGPLELYSTMYKGSFGAMVSIQNSLLGAAGLTLVALCTALPSRVGLVIIGGDGALALGGLAAAMTGLALKPPPCAPLEGGAQPELHLTVLLAMALAGMTAGAMLIALAGLLRHWRGVNETISSLLLSLTALGVFKFLAEGPWRDPNPTSANKPSTAPIFVDTDGSIVPLLGSIRFPEWLGNALDQVPYLGEGFRLMETALGQVHWGFALGVILCVLTWLLMYHTTFGFAARMVGGNVKAAQAAGLPVGWILLVTCLLAGAAAGLAGAVEIAAIQGQANASLFEKSGLTLGLMGVLVAFLARHNPLGVIVVSIMIGGVLESSSMMQRALPGVKDSAAQALLGILMVMIILSETLYGRFRLFLPREVRKAMANP
jgi:simple sugar transport system permease protein